VTSKGYDDGEITDNKFATPDDQIENVIDGFKLELLGCNNAIAKVVVGADSNMGAFGTNAVSNSTSESACRFELSMPANAYTYQQIKFKVMGADRKISYKLGDDFTSVGGTASEWKSVTIDIAKPEDFNNKLSIYMTAEFTPTKMMRLDDIEVWGKKNTGASSNANSDDPLDGTD
jgi:hypothetical protein